MSSLPLVFSSDEKVVSTTDWYISLSKDEETYKNCFVRRITHIKNLKSSVLHEFIQVIFEDKTNSKGDRTRVIAERQTKQDQLIFGRWSYGLKPSSKSSVGDGSGSALEAFTNFFRGSSSSSSSSGGGGILPLPLLSLTFDNDNLSVLQLAEICLKTTEQLGTYDLITRNCYCFSAIVYEAARLKYAGVVKDWPYASLKGKLALWVKLDSKAKASFPHKHFTPPRGLIKANNRKTVKSSSQTKIKTSSGPRRMRLRSPSPGSGHKRSSFCGPRAWN